MLICSDFSDRQAPLSLIGAPPTILAPFPALWVCFDRRKRRPEGFALRRQTLFAIGAGGQVVAVDDYSEHPEAARALLRALDGTDALLGLVAEAPELRPDTIATANAAATSEPTTSGVRSSRLRAQ